MSSGNSHYVWNDFVGFYQQSSSLNLSVCEKISDKGVSDVADGCPVLKSIGIYHCKKITNEGVSALAHKCPCLRSINALGCIRLSKDIQFTRRVDYPRLVMHLEPIDRGWCGTRYPHEDEYEITISHGR